MISQITDKEKNDFVLGLYFDLREDFLTSAIKRAYRDFNRTLKNFPSEEVLKNEIRNEWIKILKLNINELLNCSFENQEDFTLWHQSTCYQIREGNDYPLSQGQAQKWLNMTLKYLFVFGENRVPGITNNYKFFHIPIDNIIMDKLEKIGISKFQIVWSQIPDYDSYYKYQKDFRDLYPNRIPMDVEFELFNDR
jgi:hypothetical protein